MSRPRNCGKCNKPKTQCNCGRPTVMTPDTIKKLEDAFSYAMTDAEACLYAGISTVTLHNYQIKNPEFVKRKEALKLHPNIKARKTLVDNVGETSGARWWAEHKMSDEFGTKTKVEHSGSITGAELTKEQDALREEYEKKLRETIVKNHGERKG